MRHSRFSSASKPSGFRFFFKDVSFVSQRVCLSLSIRVFVCVHMYRCFLVSGGQVERDQRVGLSIDFTGTVRAHLRD